MTEEKDPLIDKAIELYAMFGTPASVFKDLYAEFGEDSLSAGAVKRIREKYRAKILKRREEISANIPILNITERWGYLQNILDGALEGEIVYDTRAGRAIGAKIDRTVALNTIKLANDMASAVGVVNTEDDELIRSIVMEAFDERKKEAPDMSDEEILAEIINSLGEKVKPFVDELRTQMYVGSTTESEA